MLITIAAVLAILTAQSPKLPNGQFYLASVPTTGAGAPTNAAPPPPPPPPAAQFFFPTGTDLILAAATL